MKAAQRVATRVLAVAACTSHAPDAVDACAAAAWYKVTHAAKHAHGTKGKHNVRRPFEYLMYHYSIIMSGSGDIGTINRKGLKIGELIKTGGTCRLVI